MRISAQHRGPGGRMGTVVANVQLTQISELLTREGTTSAQVRELESALSSSGAAAASGATTPGGRAVPPEVVEGVKEAVTTAVSTAYWVAAGVMVAAALLAFALLRRQVAADADADPEAAAETYPAIG
ncbi:hypothetical protein [Conexibacter arvalis]|uniref:Uncharacterized protein n=1 Tax=Conexibacter arvalis TaxID=912552 RepID=A0A840IMD2_9ACTN|nr:hypothetical protein [Conexibacter arvalis]MBB4665020.1 hypothetical protein [Conexibacter arvalis]